MTEFTYNKTIEYEDCTRDLNFEAARRWAAEHGAEFAEDIAARKTVNGKLMRYFVIGSEPAPVVVEPAPVPEPTVEELQNRKRWERNAEIENVMARVQRYHTQKVAGLETTETSETVEALLLYAQYLRDFPQQDGEWWNAPILTFEEWGEAR